MDDQEIVESVLGKPYEDPGNPPKSFSCLDLAAWVRRKLGLETPFVGIGGSWDALTADTQLLLLQRTQSLHPWRQVPAPSRGDIVLCSSRRGLPSYHCGIWILGGVLHAYAAQLTGRGSVVRTRMPAFEALYTHVEYWRLDCGSA